MDMLHEGLQDVMMTTKTRQMGWSTTREGRREDGLASGRQRASAIPFLYGQQNYFSLVNKWRAEIRSRKLSMENILATRSYCMWLPSASFQPCTFGKILIYSM